MKQFLVLAIAFLTLLGGEFAHALSTSPLGIIGADGWTVFTQVAGSKTIYVSSSTGNDQYCSGFASTPYAGQTSSAQCPKKTIAAGKALLTWGLSDWLLLKKGDVWSTETLGAWGSRGASALQPQVVSTYGTGARPIVYATNARGILYQGTTPLKHLAFVGIHFKRVGEQESVRWLGMTENLLFEDCVFEQGILAQATNFGEIKNIVVRRSQIIDAYHSSKIQGVFFYNVDGILIEENLIDNNGYLDANGKIGSSIVVNHNIYIQSNCANFTLRKNIIMRAPSHGVQARSGGTVEDNFFYDNAMGVVMGLRNDLGAGTIRRNVILKGKDIVRTNADMLYRAWGIELTNAINPTGRTVVTDNIVAHDQSVGDETAGIKLDTGDGPIYRTDVTGNTIFNSGRALVISGDPATRFSSVIIANNSFHGIDLSTVLVSSAAALGHANVQFSGNNYYATLAGCADSSGSCGNWFKNGASSISFSAWKTAVTETTATNTIQSFVDPYRTVASYHQSLIDVGVQLQPALQANLESLLTQLRLQSKSRWRNEFTALALNEYFREGFAIGAKSGGADITAPLPGNLLVPAATNSDFNITYSGAADNALGSGLINVRLWVKKDGGAWNYTGMRQRAGAGVFTYTPTLGEGTYRFTTVAIDASGNTSGYPSLNSVAMGQGIFDRTSPLPGSIAVSPP